MVPGGGLLESVIRPVAAAARMILHVDLDAFYASVELRDHPELAGRPLIVGGPPSSRGVVCAASYSARARGVRSAMPCYQAARLCPEATFKVPDFPRYVAASDQIRRIFLDYTALVEPLSLDEAYLDVSASCPAAPAAAVLAEEIRARIRAETGLTATAGAGPSKFIAKAASDRGKPDGLVGVPPEAVAEFVAGLPIAALPGIGAVTAGRCQALGVRTALDLLDLDEAALARLFGSRAWVMRDLARGIDERPVIAERARRSVGIERTFASDLRCLADIHVQLAALGDGLAERLRQHRLSAHALAVTLKYHDFRAVTRSRTVRDAYADASAIHALALEVLAGHGTPSAPVRLLALTASQLVERSSATQQRLF